MIPKNLTKTGKENMMQSIFPPFFKKKKKKLEGKGEGGKSRDFILLNLIFCLFGGCIRH